jgi:hypothetical protein
MEAGDILVGPFAPREYSLLRGVHVNVLSPSPEIVQNAAGSRSSNRDPSTIMNGYSR